LKSQHTYQLLSDSELLAEYKNTRNRTYLGCLLQRYTLLLLGVCMKYLKHEEEAKDAVQQVFSKAIVEVDKYPVQHFKSWLYTIARNHCFMQLRNKNYPLPEEAIDKNGKGIEPEQINETLQKIQEKEKLLILMEEALEHLQPNQRECVSLFYLQDMSYRQIEAATGHSLLKVKSFIQNGKRNIKLIIEKRLKENAS
jgi:RNA polymerase sigma-70 factor (ECF subfamily)